MKLALVDSLHPAPWFVTLLVIALAVLAAGPVARADTVYTYTGNPFEIFGGGDSCPTICSITVSFTVPAPLISMSYGTFTPEAFTITDGNTTITNATYDPVNAFFDIATDVTGTPTYWQFQAYNANDSITLFTLNVQGLVAYDASMKCTNGGLAYSCDPPQHELQYASTYVAGPGTWTLGPTSAAPEPRSLALLLPSLAALLALASRKRRLAWTRK